MQSNVTLYSLGRFFLALGIAFCLIVAGTVGPANEAMADGGGLDTLISNDTSLGGSPLEDPAVTTGTSLAGDGVTESAPSSTQEAFAEWVLKLSLFFWTPLTH